jgi:hypothetical protein
MGVVGVAALVLAFLGTLAIGPASGGAASHSVRASKPPKGAVRFATTGDHSEIRETVPIAQSKWQKARVVMSIGPGELPTLHRNDILRTTAEVQVTTTCIDVGAERCIGRFYRFSPREDARIVLASRRQATGGQHAKTIAHTRSVRCHQRRPQRNHHCVLVFPPEPTRIRHPHQVPCRPSACHLNLVLEADYPRAREGQVVLVGADRPNGTVRQDKGRLNAILLHKHVPAPKRFRTAKRRSRSIPIAPGGKNGRRVIYSQRVNNLKKGDVLEASARHLVTISSLPYPAFVGADLILTHGRNAVVPTGIARGAASTHGTFTEQNGFNCTHGPSEYSDPCRTRKAGAVRIQRNLARNGRSIPLYINVVCAGEPKRAAASPDDSLRVLPRGALVVRRFRAD